MSRLDREKARAYLLHQFGLPDVADEIGEDELDALEACMVPEVDEDGWGMVQWRQHALEWQQSGSESRIALEQAESKLAKIEALCDDLETPGTSFGAAKRLRAILKGEA